MFVVDEGQAELRARALPDDDAESITGIGRNRYACVSVPAWAQAAGVIGRQRDSVQTCPSLRSPVGRLIEEFREDRVLVRPNLAGDPILATRVAALDRHQSVRRLVGVRVNLSRNRSGWVFRWVRSRGRVRALAVRAGFPALRWQASPVPSSLWHCPAVFAGQALV